MQQAIISNNMTLANYSANASKLARWLWILSCYLK